MADDEEEWAKVWRGLKSGRKNRFVDRLTGLGLDLSGVKTRAEMVLELEDHIADMADDSSAAEDYDGGFGENSYLVRAIQKDD